MELKQLITETLHKELLTETIDSVEDYFEMMDNSEYELLSTLKSNEALDLKKIQPSQYNQALKQFVKFGDVTLSKFPVNKIFQWKRITMENTATLRAINNLMGHSSDGMDETFHSIFNSGEDYSERGGEYDQWLIANGKDPKEYEYDWGTEYDFLDEVYNLEEWTPTYSNGQPLISDYGIGPIEKIIEHMAPLQNPNQILIDVNKILDITHPRSDLAELYIVGGSESLDFIAGFHKDD